MNEKEEEILVRKDWTQHNQLENITRILIRISSHLVKIFLSIVVLIGVLVYIFIYK